jgi:hypothetical protein
MNSKRLIIGVAKPWDVKKFLRKTEFSRNGFDLFTLAKYTDSYSNFNVVTHGINSPFDIKKIFFFFGEIFKKYDDILVATATQYGLKYRMIVFFSLICARRQVQVYCKGSVFQESFIKQALDLALISTNIILVPLSCLIPFVSLVVYKKKNETR